MARSARRRDAVVHDRVGGRIGIGVSPARTVDRGEGDRALNALRGAEIIIVDRLVGHADPVFGPAKADEEQDGAIIVEEGVARKRVVEGRGVSVRVDLGGSSMMKKKKTTNQQRQ